MQKIKSKDKKSGEVVLKKHVGAIHCSGSLSLLQRKIANALLSNAYNDLTNHDEHTISIKELCSLIGYDSHDHQTVKKALIKLLSTVIEWNLIDNENEKHQAIWNASSMISDASIKGSVCSYSYSRRMRELLYSPEMYGRINMTIQTKFQSSYSLALYENCIRYSNLPKTPWINFQLFRKLMGVEDGKYLIFRDFKRRVLDKATNEVNQFSDMRLETELMKEGGVVTFIRFIITANSVIPRTTLPQNIHSKKNHLSKLLVDEFDFTLANAEKIIETYSKPQIEEKIEYIKKSNAYKNKNIPNLAGYLIESLKKDYKPKEVIQDNIEIVTNDDIISCFSLLETKQKNKISDHFKRAIKNPVQRNFFEQHGLCNSMLIEEFKTFIFSNYPDIINKITEEA